MSGESPFKTGLLVVMQDKGGGGGVLFFLHQRMDLLLPNSWLPPFGTNSAAKDMPLLPVLQRVGGGGGGHDLTQAQQRPNGDRVGPLLSDMGEGGLAPLEFWLTHPPNHPPTHPLTEIFSSGKKKEIY